MFAAQTLRHYVEKFFSQVKRQEMMNFCHLKEAYLLHSFAVDNTKFQRIVGTFSFFIKLKTFCLSRVLKIFKIDHLKFCQCAYAKCPTFVRLSTLLGINGRSIGKCCGQMTFIRHSLFSDAKTDCRSVPKRHQQAYEIWFRFRLAPKKLHIVALWLTLKQMYRISEIYAVSNWRGND